MTCPRSQIQALSMRARMNAKSLLPRSLGPPASMKTQTREPCLSLSAEKQPVQPSIVTHGTKEGTPNLSGFHEQS